MSGEFCWYELRTTVPVAARAFYAEVAGWQVEQSGESSIFRLGKDPVGRLVELPERARARGAPAHWLGHVCVDDVDASVQRMVALGGQQLGPVQQAVDGGRVAVIRDPQGAVLALSSRRDVWSRGGVAWHELHTTDREQAWSTYAELFGWKATETLSLGPEVGPYQMFSWAGAERSVGAMASTARAPHVHTHWLFYLTVADLDGALAKLRALGGRVLNGPMQVRGGDRVAQCEDPQGAAFALHQDATRFGDST
ncbi:MAG: VOC family protein [Myxococcaceae bacterium]|nr:VOC family protein [Myxococcaceae bacterium]